MANAVPFFFYYRQNFDRVQLVVIQSLTDMFSKLVAAHGMVPAFDVVFVFHHSIDSLHVSFENDKFTARQIMQSEFGLEMVKSYAI